MNEKDAKRFMSKIIINGEDDCWEWAGSKTKQGYGRFNVGNNTIRFSHRLSWENQFGKIPDDMRVCHKCDNPPCCNPNHLFIGSRSDNNKDASQKGRKRGGVGEKNSHSKLTNKEVSEIREKLKIYKPQTSLFPDLAREYGVTIRSVWNIYEYKTWKTA